MTTTVTSQAHSGKTFAELGVAAEIVDALAERGITHTFAIQEHTLALALKGQDIIGQARTGTGKTYGFAIPLLDRVFDDAHITAPDGSIRALVLVPTRELCLQVTDDITQASRYLRINGQPLGIHAIYGGVPAQRQITALQHGGDIIIGTPGRLLDLHHQGVLQLGQVEIVVLDEADEMLDQGFLEDVTRILEATSPQRQTMLFSATMPGPIVALTRAFMRQPVLVQADNAASEATHAGTRQIVFQSHKMDRMSALARLLQTPGRGRTIVFARTKRQTAAVAEQLAGLGFRVGAVHGDMKQSDREASLQDFRTTKVDVMVATDVAARGIDIDEVTHVINYQVPEDERTYVHRIGRTGRAGQSGTAVTLLGWDELPRWQSIDEALGLGQPEPPQWFSTSAEFLEAFGLPEGITDRVGAARRVAGGMSATVAVRKPRRTHPSSSRRHREGTSR